MRLSLLAAALLLAGCGTSLPSKFYVLTADPAPPRFGAPAGSTVGFGRVSLPGALDRPALARRRGGNEIVYSEEERWAGPLDDMVRRVLADDLAARLPAGSILAESAALMASLPLRLWSLAKVTSKMLFAVATPMLIIAPIKDGTLIVV